MKKLKRIVAAVALMSASTAHAQRLLSISLGDPKADAIEAVTNVGLKLQPNEQGAVFQTYWLINSSGTGTGMLSFCRGTVYAVSVNIMDDDDFALIVRQRIAELGPPNVTVETIPFADGSSVIEQLTLSWRSNTFSVSHPARHGADLNGSQLLSARNSCT